MAAWTAALALAAVLAAPASADPQPGFDGQWVSLYSSGTGLFDAAFYAHHGGQESGLYSQNALTSGKGDAGIALTIYSADGSAATVYGLRGSQPLTPYAAPHLLDPLAAGTTMDPYDLVSSYVAGDYDIAGNCVGNPCLKVTENFQYGDDGNPNSQAGDDVLVKYHVDNEGDQAVRFRLTAAADVEPGYDEGGLGLHVAGPPQIVGTQNPAYGGEVALQESGARTFSHYQEDIAYRVWARIERPLSSGASGLSDSVNPAYGDKAVAAEWDNYNSVATPLAPGAGGADFQYLLLFHDWDPLSFTDPQPFDAPKLAVSGASVTVQTTAKNYDGTNDTAPVRWRVNSGPNAASVYNGPYTRVPAAGAATGGHADLTWQNTATDVNPFTGDDADAFVDLNDNGIHDSWEPADYRFVYWYDQVEIDPYDNNPEIGTNDPVDVGVYDSGSKSPQSLPFLYKVSGVGNPPSNSTVGAASCDPISGPCEYPDIDVTSNAPGDDWIDVWVNLNPGSGAGQDSDYTDPGEHRRMKITWQNYQLQLFPADQAAVHGSTATITARLRDENFDAVEGVSLHYTVSGPNGYSASGTTSPTVADAFGEYGAADVVLASPPTNGQSKVTVWQELGGSASAPDANDLIASSTIDWAAAPTTRFTLSPDATNKTVGAGAATVTATLLDDNGSADATPYTIVYRNNSGPDGFLGERTVTNGATGHATIPLNGVSAGTDHVSAYVDYNGNDVEDGNEPTATANVNWNDPISAYADSQTYAEGTEAGVYLQLYNPNGAPAPATHFTWSVTSGPNVGQAGAGDTGSGFDAGVGSFTYTGGMTQGIDVVHVSFTDAGDTHSTDVSVAWIDNLSVTGLPSDVSTGAKVSASITLLNASTTGPAPTGTAIAYNLGEAAGSGYAKTDSVETDAAGHATISWTPTVAGTDYLTAWADYNHNGEWDYSEPIEYQYVQVHNRVEVTPAIDSKWQGDTETVTVNFRDDHYQPLANKPLTYDISGPNAVTGKTVTTNAAGSAQISWVGDESSDQDGYSVDQLTVFQDTNANGTPDPGEHASDPMVMYWSSRLTQVSSQLSRNTGQQETATYKLVGLDGTTPVASTPLAYSITGANPASGTVTTNASGVAQLQWTGLAGGEDDVTVWQDLDSDGVRDRGEPVDTSVAVYWQGQITFSPTQASAKYQGAGQSQVVSVSNVGNHPMHYEVFGANPVAEQAVPGSHQITLDGASAGTDSLWVWADVNNDSVYDSGDADGYFNMVWKSRIGVSGGGGGHVAGGHVQFTATLLDSSGDAVLNAPADLKYKIVGANPTSSPQTVQTSNLGSALVEWDGDNAGSDVLTVWKDDDSDGQVDPGEFTTTKTVSWSAPPVVLTLTHVSGASAYQGNSHDVNVNVTGISVPPAGFTVHWSVTGANTASGTVQTDAAGAATTPITWTGSTDGTDTLTAYADVSGTNGVRDSYDPGSTTQFTWTPLLQGSAPTSDQTAGEQHTETIHLVNPNGTPAANVLMLYTITGANPTGGVLQARAISGRIAPPVRTARTDNNGDAAISWVGSNPAGGTDTMDAYGDTDSSGTITPSDPHARRTVTWRTASAAGNAGGPSGGSPTGSSSAVVVPGSINDIDGLLVPPPPVVAKSVNVAPVKGHVYVKLPGKKKFIELLDAEQIPVGSIVDVRKGTVALTSAQNLKGGIATAQFYSGEFQIGQKRSAKPITDLTLVGGNFKVCGKAAKSSLGRAARKKKIRELWGKGHGLFRTKGKFASATIRGTQYDVVDYCDGTLIKVTQGMVAVQNYRTNKTTVVKAPKSLFIAAKK